MENDLPAMIKGNGDKGWFVNGECHRENDLPAIIKGGGKKWYKNGKQHRDNDLPAEEYVDGTNIWYVNGELHRLGGFPAVENVNGDKQWYVNGKLHRDNGLPAVEFSDGDKKWWIYDKDYTYEEVCNFYKILKGFGRYCLRKIRMRRLRRTRYIHGELLCMPVKGSYPGGQDYHKMVSYFMSM
jgi:hypothetical protein